MKIAVLLGGISTERNISLLSGRATVFALRDLGHEVVAIDPMRGAGEPLTDQELHDASAREVTMQELDAFDSRKLLECATSAHFDGVDVAFNLLHGRYGEDGYMQSLLDLRGIPYTGSTMLASASAMDKGLAKLLFQSAGIPTAPWVNITHDQFDDDGLFESVMREIPGPLVVKPNDQGSTVGMTILDTPDLDSLEAAVRLAGAFTSSVMIEAYVPGRELTVAVLGSEALPVIEIVPKEGYYDFENKYVKGKTEYHCPADISDVVDEHVRNLAVAAHGILGCRAYSRVDFRLTPEGMPFCLEVNTIPGFTSTSLVPMAARQGGLEFPQLCMEIIRLSGVDVPEV